MSYPVFPSSVPLARPSFKQTPHFNTNTQKPAAVRGIVTASLVPYPTWDFECEMTWSRGDLQTPLSVVAAFVDVYMQCLGSGGFFLFPAPAPDNTVALASGVMLNVTPGAAAPMSIVGDGVSEQFQLARSIGPSGLSYDIIQNINGTPNIYVNGVQTHAFSISSTGVVSFNPSLETPGVGASLTWSGGFYYLCQFSEDTLADLARMGVIPNKITPAVMDSLWTCGGIKFSSVFV